MKTFGTNDWIVLNHIIYRIHSMDNLDQMRSVLLEQLRSLIRYDSADFFLASEDGKGELVHPVFYNADAELGSRYMKNFFDIDYSKGLLQSGKSIIYRETDLMPEEQRVQSQYYKSYFLPEGWHYGLDMLIADHQRLLGVVTLYRKKGEPDFEYEDIFILELLMEHLEFRLLREAREKAAPGLTVEQCAFRYQLTKREETILSLLLLSESNESICEKLCITNNTLKKHILNLYRKLQINSRSQLLKLFRGN